MSMYYPPLRPNEIYHWGIEKGGKAKTHKWIARVVLGTKMGKNLYRYFYNQDEYNRYLKNQNEEKTKRGTDIFSKLTTVLENTVNKVAGDKDAASAGKYLVDKLIANVVHPSYTTSWSFSDVSETTRHIYDVADRKYRDKVISRIEDGVEQIIDDKPVKNYKPEVKNVLEGKELKPEDARTKLGEVKNSDGSISNPTGERKYKYVARITMPDGSFRYFYDQASLEAYNKKNGMGSIPYDLKDKPMTSEEDREEINEQYYDSVLRQKNCYACTMAYELRRRGFDVEATDAYIKTYKDSSGEDHSRIGGETIDEIAQKYKTGGSHGHTLKQTDFEYTSVDDTPEQLYEKFEKNCLAQGEGTRGIIVYNWATGGGHVNNWEVIDGKVVIIDSQINESYSNKNEIISHMFEYTTSNFTNETKNKAKRQMSNGWADDYTYSPISWVRTDDKQLNNQYAREVSRANKESVVPYKDLTYKDLEEQEKKKEGNK